MPVKTLSPAPVTPTKVGFVSLGCPKNLVDSEIMMGMLAQAGATLVTGAEEADVIVVNTCSFIASAQQESVNTILEMAKHKTTGRAQKLVVAGCLVERFRNEIQQDIPEVDAVVGTGELEGILAAAGISSPGGYQFSLQHFAVPARRRCSSGSGPFFAGKLGRRNCRSAKLLVRRHHAACSSHAATHRLHQNCGGLRSPLHVLHHPAAAGEVSVTPV